MSEVDTSSPDPAASATDTAPDPKVAMAEAIDAKREQIAPSDGSPAGQAKPDSDGAPADAAPSDKQLKAAKHLGYTETEIKEMDSAALTALERADARLRVTEQKLGRMSKAGEDGKPADDSHADDTDEDLTFEMQSQSVVVI